VHGATTFSLFGLILMMLLMMIIDDDDTTRIFLSRIFGLCAFSKPAACAGWLVPRRDRRAGGMRRNTKMSLDSTLSGEL